MRPHLLDPLFAQVSTISGVGPKLASLFDRLAGPAQSHARIRDLIFHLPVSLTDRRIRKNLAEAISDTVVTLPLRAAEHRPPPNIRAKSPYRILCEDQNGHDVMLVYFHAHAGQMEKLFPLGAQRWVSGLIERWDGHWQMVHPDRVYDERTISELRPVDPVYPATEGLTQRVIARTVAAAVLRVPDMPEWIDAEFLARQAFPGFKNALLFIHQAQQLDALEPMQPARRRLAYDELLASQLALVMVRSRMRETAGRALIGHGQLSKIILESLPYELTQSQTQAIADIRKDMAEPKRMLRLLQGDVGSGKTIVGLLAMVTAIEAGKQAALMAPTEILARQHYERIQPLAAQAGISVALLTGRDKAAQRALTRGALASGAIQIAIGTHALFQEDVAFHDLGLAVVDEQHRFGVHQRLALGGKGEQADVLVMTATPIPRTLVLTYFGDIELSVLREKPAGRQPIDTRSIDLERLPDVVAGIQRAVKQGAQVYWVCPLVEESEKIDAAAAQDRFEDLQRIFGDKAGLLHGQQKAAEKDAAMARFMRGETRVLVSTTVIEVGVDVPNASIMVIEHAERFGLSQLHQLRGRIGRGAAQSTCLLLYKSPLGETARARLSIMRETDDGFRIAEEDLRLRGEGDLLGTAQSGLPGFKLVRPDLDADLLAAARDDAKLIVARDPELKTQRGEALRHLLYLFERDDAVRLIRAG